MKFKLTELFLLNEIGERKTQEDCIFPALDCASLNQKLFVVCDGVGGHAGGDIASRTTCNAISEFFYRTEMFTPFNDYIQDALKYTFIKFKQVIDKNPRLKFMSTTLALAYIVDNGIWTAWCGDSRIYHIRNGKVLWHSKDHSLIQNLIDTGKLAKHNRSWVSKCIDVLSRSINIYDKKIETDIHFIEDVRSQDYILLCTDGLLEHVTDYTMAVILDEEQKEKDKLKLFKQHCENWTMDNYSMILLKIQIKQI